MPTTTPPPCFLADGLPSEHRVLCRQYAAVQERCSGLIAQQQADIAHLQGQVVRLRAALIVRDTALAMLEAAAPAKDPEALWLARTRMGRQVPVRWMRGLGVNSDLSPIYPASQRR